MIPFTQYLLPNGRRQAIAIERPEEIEKMAEAIIAKGHRFEAEILRTGEVSLTITSHKPDEMDVGIEISSNGPAIEAAVDKLVTTFYNEMEKYHVENP